MALILNYSCSDFQVLVGGLNVTDAVTGFRAAQNKFEIGEPLIWRGALNLVDLPTPYALPESLDYLINPSRWSRGRHPVKIYFWGELFLTLRINKYFYDPDTQEAEAELIDILGLVGTVERSPRPLKAVQTSARMDLIGKVTRQSASWKKVALGVATKGSVVGGAQYIRPAQVVFPPDSGDRIPSYTVSPQLSANPVGQLANIAMASEAMIPWCDRHENIRFVQYPLQPTSPRYRLARVQVEDFKRLPPDPEDAPTSVSANGTGTGMAAPEPRGTIKDPDAYKNEDGGFPDDKKSNSRIDPDYPNNSSGSNGDGSSFLDPDSGSGGINDGAGIDSSPPNWDRFDRDYGNRELSPDQRAESFPWNPGQDPDKDPFTDPDYGAPEDGEDGEDGEDEGSSFESQIIVPKYPIVRETYGPEGLLWRETIKQPSAGAHMIWRESEFFARISTIIPDSESSAFATAEERKEREEYDAEEGKLLSKYTIRSKPLGSIAPDVFPGNTARVCAEEIYEQWKYNLDGTPIEHSTTIWRPVCVIFNDATKSTGRIVAERIVESWTRLSYSLTDSKFQHKIESFKTKGELYPDKYPEDPTLTLTPDQKPPEVVALQPAPIYMEAKQPLQFVSRSERKEFNTSGADPSDNPQPDPEPDLGTDTPPTSEGDEPPAPEDPDTAGETESDYGPDGGDPGNPDTSTGEDGGEDGTPDREEPPATDGGQEFEGGTFQNPKDYDLTDVPDENGDALEKVAETAGKVGWQRQGSHDISHPMKLADLRGYRPLQRVDIHDCAFVRDGFGIALGEGEGGGKELAVTYTGNLIGKIPTIQYGIAPTIPYFPIPIYQVIDTPQARTVYAGIPSTFVPGADAEPSNNLVEYSGSPSVSAIAWSLLCTSTISSVQVSKAVAASGYEVGEKFSIAVQLAPGFTLSSGYIEIHTWTQEPNSALIGRTWLTDLPVTGGNFVFIPDIDANWFSVFAQNDENNNYYDAIYFTIEGQTVILRGF